MALSGYSGTPLLKKLGILPGMKIRLLHAPENYFDLLEKDILDQLCGEKEIPGLVHFFAKNKAIFSIGMKKLLPLCKKDPGIVIWVSWYKKTSGMNSDLTENIIRDFALENGFVDVKVCAVSNLWSALKLVVPLAKR